MKLRYDDDADAFYLRLNDEEIIESEEMEPDIILDFNHKGQVVGIEVLHVRERVPAEDLKRLPLAPPE